MARRPASNHGEVIDPVTGKPIRESRLNSLVVGDEVMPEELDYEITEPDPGLLPVHPVAPTGNGVQFIGHLSDPDDDDEVKALVGKLREKWREQRKEFGLD